MPYFTLLRNPLNSSMHVTCICRQKRLRLLDLIAASEATNPYHCIKSVMVVDLEVLLIN